MSQRILVTGVNGQVGKAIVALNNEYQFKLIPINRSEWDMAKDPLVANAVVKMHQPDIVINSAAYTNVDAAEEDRDVAYAVNATAVRELAKACNEFNIPLLHVSTDYVFDGTKDTPYTEEDPVNPINFYGRTKAAGEEFVRQELIEHVILRTSWVFSNTGKNFVTTMRRLGKERKEIKVVNDQLGGPTSATSIARLLLNITHRLFQNDTIHWGTYHFAGKPAVSWYQFAAEIFKAEGLESQLTLTPISSSQFQTIATRPKNSVLSTENVRALVPEAQCDWKEDLLRKVD